MPSRFEGDTVDSRGRGPSDPPAVDEHLYLLVLEGNRSAIHQLPRSGTVAMGRGPEAGIRVDDPSVSRQHAEVVLENGVAHIVDLGSHNGVRVNGEAVSGSQAL